MDLNFLSWYLLQQCKTRLHSSGMRPACLLTISQHALLREGCTCPGGLYLPRGCTCLGVYLPRGGVYLPGGRGVPAWGEGCVPTRGCTCQGCTSPGGVPAQGCTCPGGVSQHAMGQAPPVNRMTDRFKNITFANFVCGW